MIRSLRHPLLLPLLVLLALPLGVARPAAATSYVAVDDTDLVDQAAMVVEARVTAVEPAPVSGLPATDYTIEVERLLAGSAPGTTLIVRVPGGERSDGMSLEIYGAPTLRPGDRPMLFLSPRSDGTFEVLHLMQGAFHRLPIGAQTLAVRSVDEAVEVEIPGRTVDPQRHAPRDFERFAAWVADRGVGIERAKDYYLSPDEPGLSRIGEKFTLFVSRGLNLRWFDFDVGGAVTWQANSAGQPGVAGGGFQQFQQALDAWTAEGLTPIRYVYGGTTGASGGLSSFDGVNSVLFDDPNNEIGGSFDCGTGGTLAIGGPWFDGNGRANFRGQTYIPILGADIVMNDGIECFFNRSPCGPALAAEVYGHELGHTLGIGHSCGDASSPSCADPELNVALMRATAHADCRGPRLELDDRRAARALYQQSSGGGGGGGGSAPDAPTGLTASLVGNEVFLDWTDASDDEIEFQVSRAIGNGDFEIIGSVPANFTTFLDGPLAPGTTYRYRVVAVGETNASQPSNIVSVNIPSAGPLSVAILPLDQAATVGTVSGFEARFTGPVVRAEWSFGDTGLGFSSATCGPSTLCRDHIFTEPGNVTVRVRVFGDLGQSATDQATVNVGAGSFAAMGSETFVQSVIFGTRGDTGTFESDVWVYNAGDEAALVEVTYLPRGLADPSLVPRNLTLDPGESVYLPNVLDSVFELDSGQGSLLVRGFTPGGQMAEVYTISRSFVEGENPATGSFGQFVGGQAEGEWSAEDKVVTGILEGDGFVATLLAANVDTRGGRVDMDLFDRNGAQVGQTASFNLGPNTVRFRRVDELFPGVASRPGPFTARYSSNGIEFLASATLLETGSEDQVFIPAEEPQDAEVFILPRIVRAEGQFGVFLISQVSVLNNASVPTQVTFEFLERGQNNLEPPTVMRTIPPNGLLAFEDVVQDLFGLEDGTGALRVTWSNTQDIAPRVVSVALSETPEGARFGKLVDSRTVAEATTTTGVDFGAEQSRLFRASYGVVNLSDGPTRLQLTVRSSAGDQLATRMVALAPFQQLERNLEGLFPGLGDGVNWTVVTEVTAGGPVLTYLANINASGDIFFVPGRSLDDTAEP